MEMTPYQWHMCSDETWLRGLLSPTARVKYQNREDAAKFIENYKQKNPMGNERRALNSEIEEPVYAQWKTREARNDYLWVECSNCGFIVENYIAVDMKGGNRSENITGYKYHACPKCEAKMRMPNNN
jgi:DNA-directed RNA polymerase subunit RPC12/RpoP